MVTNHNAEMEQGTRSSPYSPCSPFRVILLAWLALDLLIVVDVQSGERHLIQWALPTQSILPAEKTNILAEEVIDV